MQTTAKKCNHGANIRRWREWRNVNQDVLAEEIGVSQATLSGYEKKETLEQEILDKIAVALNIPVEAITELDNAASINIVSSTLYDKAGSIFNNPTFNPIDKVIELYNEKKRLIWANAKRERQRNRITEGNSKGQDVRFVPANRS